MEVWRISRRRRALESRPFPVEGFWTSAGDQVIYTTESVAQGVLELLTHSVGVPPPNSLFASRIVIPDRLTIPSIDRQLLPENWADEAYAAERRRLVGSWLWSKSSATLRVPSTIHGHNYLLNPLHPDFVHIAVVAFTDVKFDSRLSPPGIDDLSRPEGQTSALPQVASAVAASVEAAMPGLSPDRPLRVFLSYSSPDREKARNLYARLQKAKGILPWLDVEQLLPGQESQFEIEEGIRSSDIVIVLLSKQAVNRAGFFHKEMKLAVELADQQPQGTIFLIPVKLDTCDVPSIIRKWQWLDLATDSSAYEKLGRALATRAEDLGISFRISL